MKCPECSSQLETDANTLSAKCRHCGWSYGEAKVSPFRKGDAKKEPDAAIPEPIEPFSLTVRWRLHWTDVAAPLIPGAMVAFVVLRDFEQEWARWGFALVAAFFLAFMIYRLAARALNRATIMVAKGQLVVRHRPVPWRGTELRIADIRAIGALENDAWEAEDVDGIPIAPRLTTEIVVQVRSGDKVQLLESAESRTEAERVAHALRRGLRLERRAQE